jgi:diguanylate cyclase (GGDEF)-like protein
VREHIAILGLSIGVACVTPNKKTRSRELVRLADEALYRAKHLGRNRTEVAAKAPAEPAATLLPDSHKAA